MTGLWQSVGTSPSSSSSSGHRCRHQTHQHEGLFVLVLIPPHQSQTEREEIGRGEQRGCREERGHGEEEIRRPSTSGSLSPNPDNCTCRIVQIVKTDLTMNLFRCLIFCPQRFVWINTQKILLYFVCGNKTLKGSKKFCVGRTVLHVRKHSRDSEEYQWNLFVLAHCDLFCYCLIFLRKRRNQTFSSTCHKNRVVQGQNLTLFFFSFFHTVADVFRFRW